MLTVAKTGSGNFQSISAALTELEKHPEYPKTIYIQSGIYKERVTLHTPGITLIGENPADTIITEGLYANMDMPDNSKRGTFRSYTMLVDADNITLKNLTIENSAGDGRKVGQALALYADGDQLCVQNCRLLGHQDTLFTGPLPPREREPGGFTGP